MSNGTLTSFERRDLARIEQLENALKAIKKELYNRDRCEEWNLGAGPCGCCLCKSFRIIDEALK